MSIRDTVKGMIEVEVAEDHSLDATFETLLDPRSSQNEVLYRRRGCDLTAETVPADLVCLTQSLKTELRELLQHIGRS